MTEERTTGRGPVEWRVQGESFVFERPLRQADLAVLGGDAPGGPVLGARVPDLVAKAALVADVSGLYFTTPHSDDYLVLVLLDRIPPGELEELVVDAWFARAPKRVAASSFLDQTDRPSSS